MVYGQINSDAIVDGAVKILDKRTKANALYIYEQKVLRHEKELEKVIPLTLEYVKLVGLKGLITSPTVLADLIKEDVSGKGLQRILVQRFEKLFKTEIQNDMFTNQRIREENDRFEIQKNMYFGFIKNRFENGQSIDPVKHIKPILSDFKTSIDTLDDLFNEEFNAQPAVKPEMDLLRARILEVKETLSMFEVLADTSQKRQLQYIMFQLLKVEKVSDESKAFLMLVTRLADAKSADEAAAILDAVLLQPVSYQVKRRGGPHFTIASYAGGGIIGHPDTTFAVTPFAPVGVEIGRSIKKEKLKNGLSLKGWSYSLVLYPVDFGQALFQSYTGTDSKVALEDIIAPGAMFTLGFPKWPVALYGGVSGTRTRDSGNKLVPRAQIGIALDMPLFKFN